MTDIIQIGDTVRSYDFPFSKDVEALRECYVEGVVEAIEPAPAPGAYFCYKIRVHKCIWVGDDLSEECKSKYVYPPVNGTIRWPEGEPMNGVEKLS